MCDLLSSIIIITIIKIPKKEGKDDDRASAAKRFAVGNQLCVYVTPSSRGPTSPTSSLRSSPICCGAVAVSFGMSEPGCGPAGSLPSPRPEACSPDSGRHLCAAGLSETVCAHVQVCTCINMRTHVHMCVQADLVPLGPALSKAAAPPSPCRTDTHTKHRETAGASSTPMSIWGRAGHCLLRPRVVLAPSPVRRPLPAPTGACATGRRGPRAAGFEMFFIGLFFNLALWSLPTGRAFGGGFIFPTGAVLVGVEGQDSHRRETST